MEEQGWGGGRTEFAVNKDKDVSVREGNYLHEGEVGMTAVDNTELEAW